MSFVRQRFQAGGIDASLLGSHFTGEFAMAGLACIVSAGALAVFFARRLPALIRVGCVCAVVTADLLLAAAPYIIRSPADRLEEPDAVAELLQRLDPESAYRVATDGFFLGPNRHMFHGLRVVGGYHGLPMQRSTVLPTVALYSGGPISIPALNVMNVRYLVLSRASPKELRLVRRIETPDHGLLGVFENTSALPQAFLARGVVEHGSLDTVFWHLRSPGWRADIVPVDSGVPNAVKGRSPPITGTVNLSRSTDRFRADVVAASARLLVFSEAWYPAWRGYVDGRRTKVVRAYGSMCGVVIGADRHIVELMYESVLLKIGLLVSCFSVFSILGLSIRRGHT